MSEHRLEIAYADHRDNRMIIIGGAAFDDLAEQDREFDKLPAVPDSDFIIDYYDAEGSITKDKCVSQATVEAVMGEPLGALIERGRQNEDALSAALQARLEGGAIGATPA